MNIKNISNLSFVNFKSCKPKRKNNENAAVGNDITFKGEDNDKKLSKKEFLKQMLAMQAQSGVAVNNKECEKNQKSQIETLACEVEKSISSEFEDEIFKYHNFVKKLLKENKGKNNGYFVSPQGVKYFCMHNFSTIQIEQRYKGIPYDNDWHYQGYPNGRLPKEDYEKQTAFIYCQNYNPESVVYEFRNYNLDDDHGYTDALILDDKFSYIETGHDAFSPYKIKYLYDKSGNLKRAKIIAYRKTDKAKDSIFIFDENRKVSKIYYDIKTIGNSFRENYKEASAVYERNEQGGFDFVGENVWNFC